MISAMNDVTHHAQSISAAAPDHLNPLLMLHSAADGRFMLWILDWLALAIGFVCSCIALNSYLRIRKFKALALADRTGKEVEIGFRDALIAGGQESVLLLGEDSSGSFTTAGANALLQAGMDGPDAKHLAISLDKLLKIATPFEFQARAGLCGTVGIRGAMIEQRPVLFLKDQRQQAYNIDYCTVLNALPVPVWIRGHDLTLSWANQAFLDVTHAKSLEAALISQAAIEPAERELAVSARQCSAIVNARSAAIIGETDRTSCLSFARLPDTNVAAIAIDVTDLVQAEATIRLNEEAANDMLEGMPTAIAIFGKDQRLSYYNNAYAQMWDISTDWLDKYPQLGQILDRLRENNRLPEQPDFQIWKRQQLELFGDCSTHPVEFWHLSGGKSLRIVVRPHLLGGIYMLFEDISAQLRLESAFTLLSQVQRATLDTIHEGIAIFGPDGRLVLHNAAFARLWRLNEPELANQPHFTRVAVLAEARVGQDSIWSIVSAGLTSGEPERCAQWGKATRADGRVISLSMARLPNGATIVTFTDLTDLENFEDLQRLSSHAVA